jgi:hypothetical protein
MLMIMEFTSTSPYVFKASSLIHEAQSQPPPSHDNPDGPAVLKAVEILRDP